MVIGLILGLQGSAWAGSGVHVHLDAHGTDHDGRVVHAHVSPHAPSAQHHDDHTGVDLHAPDDGVVLSLDPFVAVETLATTGDALPDAVFALPQPLQLAAKTPILAEGGHDPPAIARPPSRAPPSRLPA